MKRKSIIIGAILLIVLAVVVIVQRSVQAGREQVIRELQMKQQREQAEAERKQRIEQFKNQLADAKAAYTMANNELSDINSFHLLRTASEKEAQLSSQYKKIDQIKENIVKIEQELNALQQ